MFNKDTPFGHLYNLHQYNNPFFPSALLSLAQCCRIYRVTYERYDGPQKSNPFRSRLSTDLSLGSQACLFLYLHFLVIFIASIYDS